MHVPRADPHLAGLSIIVVEDDALQRRALELVLRDWGCMTTAAPSGEAALDLLDRRRGNLPDLVLSDFRLAGTLDGLSTIEQIRRRCGRAIPAIVLTGDVNMSVWRRTARRDLIILHKPVIPAVLHRVMLSATHIPPSCAPAHAITAGH